MHVTNWWFVAPKVVLSEETSKVLQRKRFQNEIQIKKKKKKKRKEPSFLLDSFLAPFHVVQKKKKKKKKKKKGSFKSSKWFQVV